MFVSQCACASVCVIAGVSQFVNLRVCVCVCACVRSCVRACALRIVCNDKVLGFVNTITIIIVIK